MTKSEIFKKAHELAKSFVGHYAARFALALKSVYQSLKQAVKKMDLRFVKMHQFMIIEKEQGIYEQHEVVDTKAATHDWLPSKFLKEQALDDAGKSMFNQLWINQNKPTLSI